MGVRITRALLFVVYIRAPDFWKLPSPSRVSVFLLGMHWEMGKAEGKCSPFLALPIEETRVWCRSAHVRRLVLLAPVVVSESWGIFRSLVFGNSQVDESPTFFDTRLLNFKDHVNYTIGAIYHVLL